MIVKDKDKFIKYLFIYKWFVFTKFSTDIDDIELSYIINALNIKSRYKRIKYIINTGCDYIDNYYNTKRINIKRKGLSPFEYRQKSLSLVL